MKYSLETVEAATVYADLIKQKRRLEADLKQLNELIRQEEEALLEQYTSLGVTSTPLPDGRLVSIRRQIWARAVGGDKQRACQALRENGLGDFTEETFNTHSLSAHFRALRREREDRGEIVIVDDLLSDALKPYIALTEDYKLGVTSGN